jgi:large subunit ribosomal protein L4
MATKKENTKKITTKSAAEPKVAKKAVVKTIEMPKAGSLSVPVLSIAGVSAGNLNLPKTIFGAEVNQSLLSQAIRVYSTNRSSQFGQTKTRGEVAGSTRKMYRQKGTGNARRGSLRSPVAVHGGIALGPRSRRTVLDLPKKMRKAALVSALSAKVRDGQVLGLELEKASGKTKEIASLTKMLKKSADKKNLSVLVVDSQIHEKAQRAIRNLQSVEFLTAGQLNAFEVIKHQSLLITKAAIERLEKGPEKVETVEEKNAEVKKAATKTRKAAK